jgi:glycosyltransferase involved in cell wall biosynthesis
MIPPRDGIPTRPTGPETHRSDTRVLVALPVFNEVDHVADVLQAVRRYTSSILVIDDGSTDGTDEVLRHHTDLWRIRHERNLGYGQSLIDAFSEARQQKFAWIITMDCDHQHEPACLPHFFRAIERNEADIISGSRYLQPPAPGMIPPPPERRAINRAITRLLNRHLGLRLTDAFCGFKAYRTAALAPLEPTDRGYGLPLQLWVQAVRQGLRITEIPVPLIYHDRRRNFAGVLENPQARMEYYLAVIERELGCYVRDEMEELLRWPEYGRCSD